MRSKAPAAKKVPACIDGRTKPAATKTAANARNTTPFRRPRNDRRGSAAAGKSRECADSSARGDDTGAQGWAYVGDRPVVESLGEELAAVVGTEVYVELRRRLG